MAIQAAISDRKARCAAALAAALTLTVALPAAAESPIQIPDPIAQALFQDGRDLLDKGQWDAACPKFEAAMILYPAASTLLNIARCYEHRKKLASAWSAYKRVQVLNRETVGEERRQAIDDTVTAELKALTPRVPKLTLTMPRAVPGAVLHIDGEEIPIAAVGTELPLDVGEHEVTASAPGHWPFHKHVDVKEATQHKLAIELLSSAEPDPRAPPKTSTWVWVSGGAGLALFGLAAGFRIDQAFVEGREDGYCHGDVKLGCPAKSEYDPAADNQRKNVDFGLSIGFAAAGTLALGASIYGLLRGPKAATAKPVAAFVVTPGGAALGAAFRF